jgi:hypothetical protein
MDRDSLLIYEAYTQNRHVITECSKGDKVQILSTPFMKQAFPKSAGKIGQIINVGADNYLIKLSDVSSEPEWWFKNNFKVID